MDVLRSLKPGMPGIKRFLSRYADRLIAVRYLRDTQRQRCLTTIEVIVDERPLLDGENAAKRRRWVKLKVGADEKAVQRAIKTAGGRWLPREKLWMLVYGQVVVLDLIDRVCPDLESG